MASGPTCLHPGGSALALPLLAIGGAQARWLKIDQATNTRMLALDGREHDRGSALSPGLFRLLPAASCLASTGTTIRKPHSDDLVPAALPHPCRHPSTLRAPNRLIEDSEQGSPGFLRDIFRGRQARNRPRHMPGCSSCAESRTRHSPSSRPAAASPAYGSVHEGFYAAAISDAGLNAFVLKYRAGKGRWRGDTGLAAAIGLFSSATPRRSAWARGAIRSGQVQPAPAWRQRSAAMASRPMAAPNSLGHRRSSWPTPLIPTMRPASRRPSRCRSRRTASPRPGFPCGSASPPCAASGPRSITEFLSASAMALALASTRARGRLDRRGDPLLDAA